MKALARLRETWKAAKDDPESGLLTQRVHGRWDRHHAEHGWWVDPAQFGLGISIERHDWLPQGIGGEVHLIVHLGPFIWGISVFQPIRATVRR